MKKRWKYFLLLLIACTFIQTKSVEAKYVDEVSVYKGPIEYLLYNESGDTRYDYSYRKKGEAIAEIEGIGEMKQSITVPETITYKKKTYTIKSVHVYNDAAKKIYLPKSCDYVKVHIFGNKGRIDIYCPEGMKEMPRIELSRWKRREDPGKKIVLHIPSTIKSGLSGVHDYQIRISKKNKVYQSKNNLVLSKSGKILYSVCNEYARKKVVIPNGVTRIAKNACASMTRPVKLPKTLKVIEKEAFCSSWNSKKYEKNAKITIPDSVTYIGEFAFAYCRLAKKVKLPKNLKVLGKHAFYGNPAYGKYIKPIRYSADGESDSIQYLLYPEAGFDREAWLYDVKKGDAVIRISEAAQETMTIPETVVYQNETYTIKGVQVYSDSKVKKLYLPKSCTYVRGAEEGITDIYCPEGMKKLPDIQLYKESYGKKLVVHVSSTIKSGISGVHDYKIRIDKENKVYQSKNNLVLSKNGKVLYSVCNAAARKKLTIPSSVTRVNNKETRKYVDKMKKRSK